MIGDGAMIIDQVNLREVEKKCTQEEPPACMSQCPLHVDGRELCHLIAEKKFNEARTLFEKQVVFPEIIARICERTCERDCRRVGIDEAIDLNALEKAAMSFGEVMKQKLFPPRKKGCVAIVGGSLTSLSLAIELKRKGFDSVIFEEKAVIGGSIRRIDPQLLPVALLEKDLQILTSLAIPINFNTKINCNMVEQDFVINYDAVFVGCKLAEVEFSIDPLTLTTQIPGVFASQQIEQFFPAAALGQGRKAAISIDRYVQKVSLTIGREDEGSFKTTLFTNTEDVLVSAKIIPKNAEAYSEEEAQLEASRCIQCECLECVKGCAFLKYYKSYPKKLLREVYNNLSIVVGTHFANGMLNSCTLCKQCEVICPNGFDFGDVCESARKIMVEAKKMPPSLHEFPLMDMDFSMSKEFFTVRHQPKYSESAYAYFPGCQLCASAPDIVEVSYADLCQQLPGGVGILLSCCGALAKWASNEEKFRRVQEQIKTAWLELGKPKLIIGCPTCYSVFKSDFVEIPVQLLWDIIKIKTVNEPGSKGKIAIHDACTTRLDSALQKNVRDIIEKLGFEIEEIKYGLDKTTCCGFGGLTKWTNQPLTKAIIAESSNFTLSPYITYCINCRDAFMKEGKEARHLLELIYDIKLADSSPNISRRRYQRVQLKQDLLKYAWKEIRQQANPYENKLLIDDELQEILEKRCILESDIQKTIDYAEATGKRIKEIASGCWIASYRIGYVTFWVWYLLEGEAYRLVHAYSHRMEIEVKNNVN